MSWLQNIKSGVFTRQRKDTPVNLWVKCDSCGEVLYKRELELHFSVCQHCGHHFRLSPQDYVRLLLDEGSFVEKDANLEASDPLKFVAKKKYRESLDSAMKNTGAKSGVYSGMGTVNGQKVSLACMDFRFVGGSLGSVEGEKIARAIKRAIEERCAVIVISASGGARMQESALSLMQMAKTSAWLQKLGTAGLPYVSILTNPTTGGVTASYAMLGDINISEPKALIGFAGERVIRETIRQNLPEGFQRAEFLLEKGFLDFVVPRNQMKAKLSTMLQHFLGN
jgi:acetyl-CoA carboxylase carboxyl transferase subunit beta